ncbi:hypothetical protein BDW42DRAFT_166562 [Aspergillus taichungensis]|uniref:Uncharacterized protein n=1 Tax=Aspergillus taichungensis TaxID=482145 RepID=A0A2J5HYJ2_9EURO|nr:hypothetical protein BDW42DRAFT_166562 [Aspergillus taichungensis]
MFERCETEISSHTPCLGHCRRCLCVQWIRRTRCPRVQIFGVPDGRGRSLWLMCLKVNWFCWTSGMLLVLPARLNGEREKI